MDDSMISVPATLKNVLLSFAALTLSIPTSFLTADDDELLCVEELSVDVVQINNIIIDDVNAFDAQPE